MYCKKCGREIDENSFFCKYCGEKLNDAPTIKQSSRKQITETPSILSTLLKSDKSRIWFIVYGLWIVLNLYWMFSGTKAYYAKEYFVPFNYIPSYLPDPNKGYYSSESYYDFSEFIAYAFGLPLLVCGIVLLYRRYKVFLQKQHTDIISTFNGQHNITRKIIYGWIVLCVVISVLDYWEDDNYDLMDVIKFVISGTIIIPFLFNWKELKLLWKELIG